MRETGGEGQPVALDQRGVCARFEPSLVEETVLLAIDTRDPEEREAFRTERDPVYEIDDQGEREAAFQMLHARWFVRLDIAEPLFTLLAAEPTIAPGIDSCLVVPAKRRRDEHADLHQARLENVDSDAGHPLLVMHLRPATLSETERLRPLLRRELVYVADMLDPAFGYEERTDRELEGEGKTGEAAAMAGVIPSVLHERYRLLWGIVVDARLASRGHLDAEGRERRRREFLTAFPMLGEAGEGIFEELFEGPRPSHRELLVLACAPLGDSYNVAGQCPLCRMPVAPSHLRRKGIPAETIRGATRDFPAWRPEDGICPLCVDLYDLRARARRPVSGRAASRRKLP